MADPAVVAAKKAKTQGNDSGDGIKDYDIDTYFAKFRPDRESKCTWTKDSCPKDSPHHHEDNL